MNETKTTKANNGKGGTMTTATTTTRMANKCECGRRMAKYASRCLRCDRARVELYREEALAIVKTGKCPRCGAALRHNSAMTGWWQCSQYGAQGFRADSTKPSCGFQTSTAS